MSGGDIVKVEELAWEPLMHRWSPTREPPLSRESVRRKSRAEATGRGGRACKGPGKAWPVGGGRRQRKGCQEGGHPQEHPRLREDHALKTKMPPSLVAENTEDLRERGQSRGQTSAGGGRELWPVRCSVDRINLTG